MRKKDLPNSKEILDKERERIRARASRALPRNTNGSLGDAGVVRYTLDTFRKGVGPDLASRLIVLKINATQWALPAASSLHPRGTDLPSDVSLGTEF